MSLHSKWLINGTCGWAQSHLSASQILRANLFLHSSSNFPRDRALILRLSQREGKVNQAQCFVMAPIHTVEIPSPFPSFLPEKKKSLASPEFQSPQGYSQPSACKKK